MKPVAELQFSPKHGNILETLKIFSDELLSSRDIQDLVGKYSVSEIGQYLKQLKNAGLVESEPAGPQGTTLKWRLKQK